MLPDNSLPILRAAQHRIHYNGERSEMMTGKLYETHIHVRNLEAAIEFYESLGMPLAYKLESRRVAFFWFGDPNEKQQTLGVWEVEAEQWTSRHFAFETSPEQLLQAKEWLRERHIEPVSSFGLAPLEPIVHCWMPAASLYFRDPDGNSLEFISVLQDDPLPDEPVMYLSQWMELQNKEKSPS